MRKRYQQVLQTLAVQREQVAAYGKAAPVLPSMEPQGLGESERSFIAQRDSFYLATVSESGWPYMQHRGGPKGFLKVMDERRLAFADYEGNRQLISAGNLAACDKVSLFLMDYAARERLKIIGRARVFRGAERLRFGALLGAEMERVSRVVEIEVAGFDWNCPKWIAQRFTRAEVEEAVAPLRRRVAELEAELAAARSP